MDSYFHDIMNGIALPPVQVGVWIPKAKVGPPAVMSNFRKPQRAVMAVQSILDSEQASFALQADLAKAFERLNPHWILRLMRIKRALRWVIRYAEFVLFDRRVAHKVQGRLLPSKVLLQGDDVGRSFSVFLFCMAMDPLCVYQHLPSIKFFFDLFGIGSVGVGVGIETKIAKSKSNTLATLCKRSRVGPEAPASSNEVW